MNENIYAFEVDGTFDDCQNLVKRAFLNEELLNRFYLSSANSINIARLIPQSIYYFRAYAQLPEKSRRNVFSVPSGNFGNLTAGLIAKKMGLPIDVFIAAVNANDIFPSFIASRKYEPKTAIKTLSNAMDVGNPSNFFRITDLYQQDINLIKENIYSCNQFLLINCLRRLSIGAILALAVYPSKYLYLNANVLPAVITIYYLK